MSTAWIDRAHVSASSGRALLLDSDGTRLRIVGQLEVQASVQPAIAVTLQVPVPPGLPGVAKLVMYASEKGELGERIQP